MKCRLIAAGTRLPEWVNAGFHDYQKRLRAPLELELKEIPVALRRAGESPSRSIEREGANMLAALSPKEHVVALAVDGPSMSTQELRVWLAAKLRQAKPLALLIGGPDGLAPACIERADERWSLSALTLPHALARIVVAEALYRAASLMAGHPYHRA
jgi:23S rRNA (pseudouridine1915-N3)-methyltransferase